MPCGTCIDHCTSGRKPDDRVIGISKREFDVRFGSVTPRDSFPDALDVLPIAEIGGGGLDNGVSGFRPFGGGFFGEVSIGLWAWGRAIAREYVGTVAFFEIMLP